MAGRAIDGAATAIVIGYSCVVNTPQASSSTWFLLPVQALLWAALLSAFMALLQWLSLTDSMTTYVIHTEPGDRVFANLGQPNQLASLLLMGTVSLTYLYERKQLGRPALILGGICMAWATVIQQYQRSFNQGKVHGLQRCFHCGCRVSRRLRRIE